MLSSKALKLLRWLAEEGSDEYGYEHDLLNDRRSWMAGVRRIPFQVVQELLMHCCISEDSICRGHWEINATGREMLHNPTDTCKRIQGLLSGKIKE